jgi:hypothetical protein
MPNSKEISLHKNVRLPDICGKSVYKIIGIFLYKRESLLSYLMSDHD